MTEPSTLAVVASCPPPAAAVTAVTTTAATAVTEATTTAAAKDYLKISTKSRRTSSPAIVSSNTYPTWPMLQSPHNRGREESSCSVLLRVTNGLEVLHAAVVEEDDAAGGIYFERKVGKVVVVDENKKLMYCLEQHQLQQQHQQHQPQQQPQLSAAAARAARKWRKQCGKRRPFPQPPLPEDKVMSEEEKTFKVATGPAKSSTDTDIEERILRRKEMAHLFQWYYPEGGWGWLVLACAAVSQVAVAGFHLGAGFPLMDMARMRFLSTVDRQEAKEQLGLLFSVSLMVSLSLSPAVVTFGQTRSTRLAGVIGGLVAALGILFTSFAVKFEQLYFSYGVVVAVGSALIRDSASLMLGQYFKRRRDLVETVLCAATGCGIAIVPTFVDMMNSLLGWRFGLQSTTSLAVMVFFAGMFYRSSTLYHPQRRAILHLKTQKRKVAAATASKNNIMGNNNSKSVCTVGGDRDKPFANCGEYMKRRSVKAVFAAAAISAVGAYAPLLYLTMQPQQQLNSCLQVQWVLGLSWSAGCFLIGLLSARTSRDCRIDKARQYQSTLFLGAIVILFLPAVSGDNGHLVFAMAYGLFLGAYHLTTKSHLHERVRSKDFAQAYSLLLAAQAVPAGVGVYIWAKLEVAGPVVAAGCLFLAGVILCMSTVSKTRLRSKRTQTDTEKDMEDDCCTCEKREYTIGSELNNISEAMVRRLLWRRDFEDDDDEEDEEDFEDEDNVVIVAAVAVGNDNNYDDFLCHVDNITSCNKVEHDLMYSEFEQNVRKEEGEKAAAAAAGSVATASVNNRQKFGRLWSLRRQSTEDLSLSERSSVSLSEASKNNGLSKGEAVAIAQQPSNKELPKFKNTLVKAGLLQKQRSITVIEEVSST